MSVTSVTFKKTAREQLLIGINKLADAVGSTLGAKGQTVIYQHGNQKNGQYLITKDGITVADQINLSHPIQNAGVHLIKQAAKTTGDRAGDGTTTSTVLTQAILQNTPLDATIEFIEGINGAFDEVMKYIDATSIEVDNNLLEYVASISTNNDKELGDLISKAIIEAGEYGTVGWEVNFNDSSTYVNVEHGAQIPRGYLDPAFINVPELRRCDLENPYIFLSTAKIQDLRQIEPILEKAVKSKKGLLIVAEMEPKAAATIASNVKKHNLPFNIINPPEFGPLRDEMMEDLSDLCQCILHGNHLGDDVDMLDEKFLGTCDKMMSTATHTTLRFTDKPDLSKKVKYLKKQIEGKEAPSRKKQLKARLAMIAGAMGVIYVGAPSEIELKEKYDRVEDAVYAVYAAKEEGILPGGGVALRDASRYIGRKSDTTEYNKGWNVLLDSIQAPFKRILKNAGIPSEDDPKRQDKGHGINVLTAEVVNMVDEGIVDPVKITKQALINAVSVATTVGNTGVVIMNIEE